jgi:ribosomal protein S18 acetylase RimI-like enzyme
VTDIETSHAGFNVNPMTVDLLTSVVALEEACGLNSRGIDGYCKMLSNPNAVLLVAQLRSDPPGLILPFSRVIGLFSGDVILDELQIDNLAVSELWRRKGIGRTLLKSALSMAAGLGARSATLEVRSANSSARAFYETEGFTPVGFRKHYYADPQDDALLLSREI